MKTSEASKLVSKTSPRPACALRVGTSGYSYTEWVTAGFYPEGTQTGKMLPLYAKKFSTTELNHTFYQMPKADMIERQRQQAPEGFLFSAKLTRTLTHEVDQAQWRGQALAYRNGIAPLLQSRQLAAVLIQLPPAFDRSQDHRRYLSALLTELEGLPLAVEFRHADWMTNKVFSELAKRRVTLVSVDEPALPGLIPALDVVTNPDLMYVRFHGRNAKGWRSANLQSQFDYHYPDAELREWAEGRIARMALRARQGVLYFNNHVRGQAPQNAQGMVQLLKEQNLQVR
jgi:uncharacterized protein YecE (DUF72 family)